MMQIERLESNWYSTAADVVSMSEVSAHAMPRATLDAHVNAIWLVYALPYIVHSHMQRIMLRQAAAHPFHILAPQGG